MTHALLKDIIQWDVKSWSKALTFWESSVDWSKVNNCLELGGREGGLSLWLALKGKNVVCSDLENVTNTASALHKKYNVSDRIQYKDIDATNIPYENHFDVIVFKSIMGGIGRNNNFNQQQKAFDEIYKALKPGGKLLFAENLSASMLHRWLRKNFVKWGDSWRYITIDETTNLVRKFSTSSIYKTGVLAAFGKSEQQRNFLSGLDNALLNKVCPAAWKYITYGIAQK